MIGVICHLLTSSLVFFVPFKGLVSDILLLSACILHLLFRLGEEMVKLLVDAFSLKLILALDLKRHL
jgi:hypothetical protein